MLRQIILASCLTILLPLASSAQTDRWSEAVWDTDFSNVAVPPDEIVDVIGKDNIPSIDDPAFKPLAEETAIPDVEPVVALEHEGVARAYPIRYLMWHEIVNDTIAGTPVAVTYCPLCNTAVVFERVLGGEPVTFGTTGKLRHSDLIMYDRAEENWWQQFDGMAIVGERAGEKLNKIPASMISFAQFAERYPDGEVLQPDRRRVRQAGTNPYVGYDTSAFPFLFNGELPEDINPMMRVALVQEPEPVAVTLPYLQENAPVTIKGLEFRWQSGQASALETRMIEDGRDVGTIEVFESGEGEGAQLVPHTVTFAFAARAFMPDLEIVQLD